MPHRDRVNEFVAAVVSGDHVAAIRDFYHEDASMQENALPPRTGKAQLMAHESKALSRLAEMRTHPPKMVLVDGDAVAIRWVFDAVDKAGVARRLEEVSLQLWQGDRIKTERFFYDTATAWEIVGASPS